MGYMEVFGICYICGKPARHVCKLCGRQVCDEHYIAKLGICTACARGRRLSNKA